MTNIFTFSKFAIPPHLQFFCILKFYQPQKLFSYAAFTIEECAQSLSHVRLFVTPWTIAHLAPLSTEFSRQYWNGLP